MVGALQRGVGLKRGLFRRCSAFMVRTRVSDSVELYAARLSRIRSRMPDGGRLFIAYFGCLRKRLRGFCGGRLTSFLVGFSFF